MTAKLELLLEAALILVVGVIQQAGYISDVYASLVIGAIGGIGARGAVSTVVAIQKEKSAAAKRAAARRRF